MQKPFNIDQKVNIRAIYSNKNCSDIYHEDLKSPSWMLERLYMFCGPKHFFMWSNMTKKELTNG